MTGDGVVTIVVSNGININLAFDGRKTNWNQVSVVLAGIGIDLTEIDRVKKVVAAEPRFVEKVLTKDEQEQLSHLSGQRRWEYISGRWSLKESFAKAMGTGIGAQVGFQDIEIIDNAAGRPIFTKSPFNGQSLASVSHTGKLVMTQVVLEEGDDQNE